MRISTFAAWSVSLATFACLNGVASAQHTGEYRIATASPTVGQSAKFQFILFWKEDDTATQAMADGLKTAVAARAQRAEWQSVNVNDAEQRATVERYHVDRAPMPIVLCVAPNGVVTGAIPRQISEAAIEHVMVTPAMTEATKALQERKFVVIHIKQDDRQPLPSGATAFVTDAMFRDRTVEINIIASDPQESRFLKELEITPDAVGDSLVVLLAPPGVLVGKFPSTTTVEQMASALHASGKCCNDPNCKYNQKGAK